jgi:hypothetical protein
MTDKRPSKVWVDGYLRKVRGKKQRQRVKGHYRSK